MGKLPTREMERKTDIYVTDIAFERRKVPPRVVAVLRKLFKPVGSVYGMDIFCLTDIELKKALQRENLTEKEKKTLTDLLLLTEAKGGAVEIALVSRRK